MPPAPEDKLPGEHKRSPLGLPLRVGDADPQQTLKVWDSVRRDVHRAHGPQRPSYLREMSSHTTILPYFWDRFPQDFTKYIKQELFDGTMTNVLEYENVINWCPAAVHLYPLWATGDGNCLLHAISLALWGVEDRELKLRHLLYQVMKGEFAAENECRWRRERNSFDSKHIPCSGFRYNTTEWSAEWKMVIELSSPEQRVNDPMRLPYDCLEEFHIYIMANILRRPIIVLAGDMWRDASGRSLQPLNFRGIYLPLAWDAKDCCRYPIILGYHQMHFSPLVCTAPAPGQGSSDDFMVPLVDHQLRLLPVHFLLEEEEGRKLRLLQEYLFQNVFEVNDNMIPLATLSAENPKPELDVFAAYMSLAETRYRMYTEEQHNPENAEALKAAGVMTAKDTYQLNDRVVNAGSGKLDDSAKMTAEEAVGGSALMKQRQPPPYDDLGEAFPKTFPGQSQRTPWQGGASSVPAAVSDPTAVRVPTGVMLGSARMKCSTIGCQYLRALPTDEYCNSCYKAQSAVGKETFKPCSTESCLNGGDREYGGLCKVCYDQSKFMKDETVMTRPASDPTRSAFSELSAQGPVMPELSQRQHSPDISIENESSTANNLNTTVINAFAVGSKKCRNSSCDFTGNPTFSGLCSTCFNREQEYRAEGSRPGNRGIGLLGASPPKEIVSSVGKKKCLVPECQLTGHPEKEDLCSGCYDKQTQALKETGTTGMKVIIPYPLAGPEDELSNIPESPYTLPAERQRELWQQAKPEQCRTPACEMFGQQSQKGLCSKCFKEFLGDSGSRSQSPQRPGKAVRQTKTGKSESLLNGDSGSNLHFTVQKNMCATPGCNGVRIQLGEGDLCLSHHRERANRYSPKVATTTRSNSPRAGNAGNTALARTTLPSRDPFSFEHPQAAQQSQPSAPPQSIYAAPYNQAYQQESKLVPRERPHQEAFAQSGAVQISKPTLCSHPNCFNEAAPPLMIACEGCITFVDKFNHLMTAYSALQSEGARPKRQEVAAPLAHEEELPMEHSGSVPDEFQAENLKNFDTGPKNSPVLKDKFQFDYIQRVKCTAAGGCPFKMFGDPSYGNLCSKCFDRDVVGIYSSNTDPLRKSARQAVLPPRPHSEVISGGTMVVPAQRSGKAVVPAQRSGKAGRPANFKECSSQGCNNQANPQVLDGYCNECYPAYQTLASKTTKSSASKHPDATSAAKAPLKSSSSARKELADHKLYSTETGGQAARCKGVRCINFGNSHCRGYCNACFLKVAK